MRTLFLVRFPPYPPTGGAPLRNWQNMNMLMDLGPVAVFSISKSLEEDSFDIPGIEVWIHHKLSKQVVEKSLWMKVKGWINPWSYALTDGLYSNLASQELAKIMTTFQPNLVIFEEPWLYRYLPTVNKFHCQVILDAHNVEADLFLAKQDQAKGLGSRLKQKIRAHKVRAIESELIRKSNQTWVCSISDAHLLQTLHGKYSGIKVIPNGLQPEYYDDIHNGETPIPPELNTNNLIFLFVGRFSYPPNEVAALFLINKIFPVIKQHYPASSLILAGGSPTQAMLQASNDDADILITGFVEDMRPYLAASTMVLVPLQEGGGTRLKILEAFASKRPVISTPKGAEGLNAKDGLHLLIRNNVDDIVAGIDEILSNPELQLTLTKNAYELLKNQYSWDANKRVVKQHLQELSLSAQ